MIDGCHAEPGPASAATLAHQPLAAGLEVSGTRFTKDGKPFFVSGVNYWSGTTLARAGRASMVGGHWIATERLDRKDDTLAVLRGWADSVGPFTAAGLAARLSLPRKEVFVSG